jgi:hypothetical protein
MVFHHNWQRHQAVNLKKTLRTRPLFSTRVQSGALLS